MLCIAKIAVMRYYVGKGYAIDLKIIQIKRKIRGISDRKRTKDIEEKAV